MTRLFFLDLCSVSVVSGPFLPVGPFPTFPSSHFIVFHLSSIGVGEGAHTTLMNYIESTKVIFGCIPSMRFLISHASFSIIILVRAVRIKKKRFLISHDHDYLASPFYEHTHTHLCVRARKEHLSSPFSLSPPSQLSHAYLIVPEGIDCS